MTLFPTDAGAFNDLQDQISDSLDVGCRLPAWPFRAPAGYVTVYEYDSVLGLDFGSVLAALASVYKDADVLVLGLQPTAEYYRSGYGFYPALRLASGAIAGGYAAGMSQEHDDDPTGVLSDTLDVIAIAGSSRAWAIWAQRDWEIGLLLTRDEHGPWLDLDVPWYGRNVELDAIRSPTGWGMRLSEAERDEFAQQIRKHGSGPMRWR